MSGKLKHSSTTVSRSDQSSIDKAATGQIQSLNHTAQDLQAYNRHNRHYPFKSRGQWLKASYGILGCCLLAFFNGWRSLVIPFSPADFIASYVSVSTEVDQFLVLKVVN
jgi:amino acid permease